MPSWLAALDGTAPRPVGRAGHVSRLALAAAVSFMIGGSLFRLGVSLSEGGSVTV
ncbi:hypothetical protein [Streptomyces sp. NPDC054940]